MRCADPPNQKQFSKVGDAVGGVLGRRVAYYTHPRPRKWCDPRRSPPAAAAANQDEDMTRLWRHPSPPINTSCSNIKYICSKYRKTSKSRCESINHNQVWEDRTDDRTHL